MESPTENSSRRSFSSNNVNLVYSDTSEETSPLRIAAFDETAATEPSNSVSSHQEHRTVLTKQSTDRQGPALPILKFIEPTISVDFDLSEEEDELREIHSPRLRPRPSPSSVGTMRPTPILIQNDPQVIPAPVPMRRVYSTPSAMISSPLTPREDSVSSLERENDKWIAQPQTNSSSGSPSLSKPPYALQRQLSLPATNQSPDNKILREKAVDLRRFSQALQAASPTRPNRASVFRANSFRGTHTEASPSNADMSYMDESDAEKTRQMALSPSVTRRRTRIDVSDDDERQHHTDVSSSHEGDSGILLRQQGRYIMYLSTFAIFGMSFRLYSERFFGLDCEDNGAVNDIFSPLFRNICVTASGTTEQTGGALFLSLPPNMIGCFIMGLMSNLERDLWPALPWFRADHPLQSNDALHVALKTGFCGALTSFSSWNTQMIVMMDGTVTELGPQIIPALCGYVLGLLTAVGSFTFGTQVSIWLNRWKNPAMKERQVHAYQTEPLVVVEEGRESTPLSRSLVREDLRSEGDANAPPLSGSIIVFPSWGRDMKWFRSVQKIFGSAKLPFVLLVCLWILYAVADAVMDNHFYRTMWLSALLSPAGVILRWKLITWTGRLPMSSDGWKLFQWIEWGTFTANVLGSIVSVLVTAINTRYFANTDSQWATPLLRGLKVGFAGSLSTVSSMAKEIVDIGVEHPYHAKPYYYALLTISSCAIVSACVYIPIVRS